MIFDNASDDKFITDKVTKTQKLNPIYLHGIQEFNQLKRLVANCSDKSNIVDINLLMSLVDQVMMRCDMMAIEMRVGDLDIGLDQEEIFKNSLYELAKTEPSTIESILAEEGQILDTIDTKLNEIKATMDSFDSSITARFKDLKI